MTSKSNSIAVAIYSGAMEFRDHFKNGAQPKSLTSRSNQIITNQI